ncbi:glucosamine-6-phosphate deaminase [Tetragenococcus halophilus]|uniref:Glucosamine-6-phosphate deaminase n=1 Tax=Tetragenococcus halophilus TaxID=51669 RepID=A0AB35HR44_TETHA|nr:glucosamine-6-phosphate deaminase [Tetragenococcus halophilus]AOF48205.1 glucosamine-6-phosphate deaminase [Tetragenococcus halophilus]MCO8284575.1 glucosamine-6-phosphate deaminase [Tetragenococcus halophilus]MCO8286576.1 glucosamine-6-phosphate deaminase [Tetragenococcus halophilus]MCO8291443.1 glucosamine-6-phosphate deaminase [Tetragenococcus halophilus]MCO8298182.1 glucosamine-6-phosphate deaminase [Tetragenococcus halophilus]
MDVIRVKNADEGGKKAFEIIKDGIANGADTFGLATGSTPETMYSYMIESDMDFSDKVSVNLDEYVGLDGNNEQSYRFFMDQHLFNHKPFKKTYVPNGKAQDLDAECQRYDDIIAANPIDIQVLGIGQNGHIGFNEPGTSFEATTHVVELTESTVNANKRYFDKVEDVPTRALTMGIQSIMKSKKIILMAFGAAKADAVKGMIDGKVTEDLPASVLQKHDDVVVIIDEDAASKL